MSDDPIEERPKVRVDWFIADVISISVELDGKLMEEMVGQATQYLKANPGGVPWEKWSLLSEASRMAFAEAAERIRVREVLSQ